MSDQTSIGAALPEIWAALGETAFMVAVSFALTILVGTLLGVLLVVASPGGLRANRAVSSVVGAVVNVGRSLPFIILLIALIPFTRLVVGTAIGPEAAIVPLTVGSIPFYARIVETSLREVERGKLEAAQSMGATGRDLVRKVLLPEAAPGLVAGATLTLVMLVGFSAMAGTIGGGGLGDFALRYGYQRFNTPLLLASVVVLVVLVQLIQSTGDLVVRRMEHRR
jgi:D-methionine transport system permease protein